MSGNVKFDKWVNDDNSENYKCRAWVNFNGVGTVAIRASGGVSSITDNGAGLYTVNFTAAMVDVNYAVICGGYFVGGSGGGNAKGITAESPLPITKSTTAVGVLTTDATFNTVDAANVNVSIFR